MIENLSFEEIENNKNEIIALLKSTNREGIDNLINYLEKSSFFDDPASITGYGNKTFHGSFEGGLALHSLSVYKELKKYKDLGLFEANDDSIIICALLHDIYKTGTYQIELKNVKENGVWKSVEVYTPVAKEDFVYGHGEKSVDMVRDFIKLSNIEKMAIRFHMGAYEGESAWKYVENAFKTNPLIFFIHVADEYCAKYIA